MALARKVWHLLVAIKDGLVLLFMLLFFVMLFGLLSGRSSAASLHDGALLLKLDGSVVEEPAVRDPLDGLLGGGDLAREHRARDVVRAITLAAEDDHIKAVVLDLSQFMGGGLVTMQEIGAALDKVRAANKPVLAYGMIYTDDAVMLAAHSSEVWLNPLGGAFVTGPGGERIYYGELLKRHKVNVHLFKVGTFKDAMEPYVLDKASEPSKEARRALYGSIWEEWKADVAKARPKADIARVTSDPVGWLKASGGDAARAALSAGLVDKLGDEVAFGERVKEIVGEDKADKSPGAFAHNRASTLLAAHPESKKGDAVAVVTVAGEIVDGKAGPGTAGGERIAALIDKATSDDAKALVLRVDSPGGSVFASEQIRTALLRFKTKGRPVVVSMGNVAASGGYWVSTPGEQVFAEPGTITGSIGIFGVMPSFEKTLADYGIHGDGLRTTPLSGQPDPLNGLTPEVEAMIQANIESGYARFIGLVAAARKKSPEQVDAIAQGRVWDGGTARQNGLIDQFGGLDDALAYAAKAAKLDSWHSEFYGSPADPYASLIERLGGGDEEDRQGGSSDLAGLIAARQQARLYAIVAELGWLGQVRGAQAYCLDCPVSARSAKVADRTAWRTILADVLGLR